MLDFLYIYNYFGIYPIKSLLSVNYMYADRVCWADSWLNTDTPPWDDPFYYFTERLIKLHE
jgi:hypothetical protein